MKGFVVNDCCSELYLIARGRHLHYMYMEAEIRI